MVSLVFQLVFLSSVLVALSEIQPISFEGSASVRCEHPQNDSVVQVEEMKMKISQLGILEDCARQSNAKDVNLEELEKENAQLTHEILVLQSSLKDIKQIEGDSSYSSKRISQLKEQVGLLWASSRKNNFDIHVLEAKVHDAEEKLEKLASQILQEANIINEQWIQIQHLEQALQMSKVCQWIRTSKACEEVKYAKCAFLKFIKDFYGPYLQKLINFLDSNLGKESIWPPYLSQSSSQLRIIMSAVQKYHHQLQSSVKRLMEKNKVTSAMANEELIFFMASVLITFPFMTLWHFLFQLIRDASLTENSR
ncbi:uncharacterized protein [Aristolochia californica]|uniref:uncharacterized protein isoform X2 n=1 Tax=Aristolochia californica TaxID=171875 RepID=UPI0035D99F03